MPTTNNPDAPLDIDALDRELRDCGIHTQYAANFTYRHAKRLLRALADCRAAMEPFRVAFENEHEPAAGQDWQDLLDVCQTVKLAAADRTGAPSC